MTRGRSVASCGIFRGVVWTPECVGLGAAVAGLRCARGMWDLTLSQPGLVRASSALEGGSLYLVLRFVYFGLCRVFAAARAFPGSREHLPSSWCVGSAAAWLLLLQSTGSIVAAHGLGCPRGTWDLLGPEIKPTPPAFLASGIQPLGHQRRPNKGNLA